MRLFHFRGPNIACVFLLVAATMVAPVRADITARKDVPTQKQFDEAEAAFEQRLSFDLFKKINANQPWFDEGMKFLTAATESLYGKASMPPVEQEQMGQALMKKEVFSTEAPPNNPASPLRIGFGGWPLHLDDQIRIRSITAKRIKAEP